MEISPVLGDTVVFMFMYTCVQHVVGFTRDPEVGTCLRIPDNHLNAATTVWEYLRVRDKLKKSDVILGLGSHDRRVAMEAARLWLAGYGDLLMYSGKSGNLTEKWAKSEAEVFRDVAVSLGVPADNIITEAHSRNTGENLKYSYDVLKSHYILPKSLIIVQKPHMGVRTMATFEKQWPGNINDVICMVTSQNISLLDYPNDDVGDLQNVISVMIGYLQRIKIYGSLGYQSVRHIPQRVWNAYIILQASGYYNSHLA